MIVTGSNGHAPKVIANLTRGAIVCDDVTVADTTLRRMRGLMGRRELPAGAGMLLRPAPAIQCAFMRFPIDAVFVDADMRVVHIVEVLKPWRAAGKRGAHSALELAAGECARRGIAVGDRLALLDHASEVFPWVDDDAGAVRASGNGHARMRVLLITSDHRFRRTATLLLARRGCVVGVTESLDDVLEIVGREEAEVVVLDAGRSLTTAAQHVATLEALSRPVGVVLVADRAVDALGNLAVLDRWGSFDDLFSAIEEAHRNRTQRRSLVERD